MSNFIHKVKDAMSGHKGSSHDSSQAEQRLSDTRDTYGSSNTGRGDTFESSNPGQGDIYGSSNVGRGDTYGSNNAGGWGTKDSIGQKAKEGSSSSSSSSDNERTGKQKPGTKSKKMGIGNNYGSNPTGAGLSTGAYDSKTGNKMDTSDTYGSGNYGSAGMGSGAYDAKTGAGNTYGSNTTGSGMRSGMGPGMGFGGYDSRMGNTMDTGNTYDSTSGAGNYGSSDYDTKGQPGMGSTGMNTGAYDSNIRAGDYSAGSNTYGSSGTGGYSSSRGPHESDMANKMDSRVDSSTGQTGSYTSDYGTTGSTGQTPSYGTAGSNTSPAYNTRSGANTGSNVGQMGSRGESATQRDFGGGAAGGSSYNAPEPSRRRSSGPHSINLLNKLDPRVKSSDYEAAGNQRGGY